MPRNLTVAAIQIHCDPLRTKENLAHAETYIEQATAQGAELVLLPELMPGGYVLTEDIWNTAEKATGPSVVWLKQTAHRFGIFLGMSYAEADGTDFFNRFVLATPKCNLLRRLSQGIVPPNAAWNRPSPRAKVSRDGAARVGQKRSYDMLQPLNASRPSCHVYPR
jgi:predicted amidohydrolase